MKESTGGSKCPRLGKKGPDGRKREGFGGQRLNK